VAPSPNTASKANGTASPPALTATCAPCAASKETQRAPPASRDVAGRKRATTRQLVTQLPPVLARALLAMADRKTQRRRPNIGGRGAK
jgi:hypothetical protein